MSRQLEYEEKTNELRREELNRKKEKEDKKKNGLAKIHKTTLGLLVMTSAPDCNETPSEAAELCRTFLTVKVWHWQIKNYINNSKIWF
eukprot:12443658-Ditylum_brightwellii.AAC.1